MSTTRDYSFVFDYYYVLPAIIASPLLIYQALRARTKVLKLPEPEGERSGIEGVGDKLKLLILGDSAGAGVGVATQEEALSGQLKSLLNKTHQLDWTLIATSGHKTEDALDNLYKMQTNTYDVVLISLGVNDVTGFVSPKKWIQQCDALIDCLVSQYSAQRIIWSDFPKMEKFPALPQPLRWFIGARKNHLRKHLVNYIAQKERLELLEFPDLLAEQNQDIKDWVALDGFHPGPRVYTIWAQEFVKQFLGSEKE